MNIATWASKEELELVSATPTIADLERMKKEYADRAAAFEDAENSKHTARYIPPDCLIPCCFFYL
jgi:hypothetical protein